ncbi:MAG: hypothetical protein AAGJ38_06080 [Planctomycetota bacterium]
MKRRGFTVLCFVCMSRVIAYHMILSAYGFWLPNDPRGSWSGTIRRYELLAFGPATKTDTTRSVAGARHDRTLRLAAKNALKYPPVRFTGEQAKLIARGFAAAADEGGYLFHALAILPDHAHLVIARHVRHLDEIASHVKAKATRALNDAELHPLAKYRSGTGRTPSPWARKHWSPYIRDARHLRNVIRYVQDNPVKAGLRRQRWSCVTPWEGE